MKRSTIPLSLLLHNIDDIQSSTIPPAFMRGSTTLLNSLYPKKLAAIEKILSEFAASTSSFNKEEAAKAVSSPPPASLPNVPGIEEKDESIKYNWLELFHDRMLVCGTTITQEQLTHYRDVLEFYLQFKTSNHENRILAKSLFRFFNSHLSDPENSLIGLYASKYALENVRVIEVPEAGVEAQSSPAVTQSASEREVLASMFTNQELIDMILKWNEMSDDDALTCIRQFATSVRGTSTTASAGIANSPMIASPNVKDLNGSGGASTPNHGRRDSNTSLHVRATSRNLAPLTIGTPSSTPPASPKQSPSFSLFSSGKLFKKSYKPNFKEGDVVLVLKDELTNKDEEEGHYIFARVCDPCVDADYNVKVYISWREDVTMIVDKDSVFRTKFKQALPEMVVDISKKFFLTYSQRVTTKTNEFLGSKRVNLAVLEQAIANETTLFDEEALKSNITILSGLIKPVPNPGTRQFLESIKANAEIKVKEFIEEVKTKEKVFPLMQSQIIQQVKDFDYISIPSARIQSYIGVCQGGLDWLATEKNKILDGTAKSKLTEWYLEHINQTVDTFLSCNGFESNVIPESYIDQAPECIDSVRENWGIIKRLIDIITQNVGDTSGEHEVIVMMHELRDEIYTKMMDFVHKAFYVISQKLQIDYLQLSGSETELLNTITNVYKEKSASLSEAVSTQIGELLKDVEYITHIYTLDHQDASIAQQKCLDIVPVSGLIACRFYRLENELRTSLDIFDPKSSNNVIKQEQLQREEEERAAREENERKDREETANKQANESTDAADNENEEEDEEEYDEDEDESTQKKREEHELGVLLDLQQQVQ